jgi:hypothetical protein
MKVNQIRTKTIAAGDPAALDTAIETWVRTQTEAVLLSVHYDAAGAGADPFSVLIVYTL